VVVLVVAAEAQEAAAVVVLAEVAATAEVAVVTAEAQEAAAVVVLVVAVVTAEAQEAAAVVVLAEAVAVVAAAATVWGRDAATVQEWHTGVATVRLAAAALDVATQALGIRGTTLCQRGVPIRKTLRTKAELTTAGAFPTIPTRGNLWRNNTRRQIRSPRLLT
jgi:hypothetical protein